MAHKIMWLQVLLFVMPALVPIQPPGAAPVALQDAYNPNELSYGLYWFGLNGAHQKFVPGEVNAHFDSARPTLIFVHGWQPFLSYSLPDFHFDGTDTAAAWVIDGWNVGIFVWNQFSDETQGVVQGGSWFSGAPPEGVKDAEAKIWTANGPEGMRWRDWDDLPPFGDGYSAAPAGTASAGELFYQTYVAAMTEQPYAGDVIRVAGHSLGNQMAVRLTKLVDDGIVAGEIPESIRPTRVALLDPYWSPGGKDYLDGQANSDVVREVVAGLLPSAGTLFEWYWSSPWTTEPKGDTNDALKPMMLYAEMDPEYALTGKDKHMAAQHLYLWSYAFDGPAGCSGESCLGMGKLLAKMGEEQLAAVMRSDYRWIQDGGAATSSPADDTYQSVARAGVPYVVTQLQAEAATQTVGGAIAVMATVADADGLAPDGTLVTFSADLGTVSARAVTHDGVALGHIRSEVPGRALVSATTRGAGGAVQCTLTVTFTETTATSTPTSTPTATPPTATPTSTPSSTPFSTATATSTPTATSALSLCYLPVIMKSTALLPYQAY
jgi:hypothetical protein